MSSSSPSSSTKQPCTTTARTGNDKTPSNYTVEQSKSQQQQPIQSAPAPATCSLGLEAVGGQDGASFMPPCDDYTWFDAKKKAEYEHYVAATLFTRYRSKGIYDKPALRLAMEKLNDMFYGDGEHRVLQGPSATATEYAVDRDALKAQAAPHLEACVTALPSLAGDANSKARENFIANFDLFLDLFLERQRNVIAKQKASWSGSVPDGPTMKHTASVSHLLFGRIVGDCLGLHPVLGALLNPTGGIVGSNNSNCVMRSIGLVKGAVFRHSLAHDAFGYLCVYHQRGPGYCYTDTRANGVRYCCCGPPLKRDDPVSGQTTGIYWWLKQIYGTVCVVTCCCCVTPCIYSRTSGSNHKMSTHYKKGPLDFLSQPF